MPGFHKSADSELGPDDPQPPEKLGVSTRHDAANGAGYPALNLLIRLCRFDVSRSGWNHPAPEEDDAIPTR